MGHLILLSITMKYLVYVSVILSIWSLSILCIVCLDVSVHIRRRGGWHLGSCRLACHTAISMNEYSHFKSYRYYLRAIPCKMIYIYRKYADSIQSCNVDVQNYRNNVHTPLSFFWTKICCFRLKWLNFRVNLKCTFAKKLYGVRKAMLRMGCKRIESDTLFSMFVIRNATTSVLQLPKRNICFDWPVLLINITKRIRYFSIDPAECLKMMLSSNKSIKLKQ